MLGIFLFPIEILIFLVAMLCVLADYGTAYLAELFSQVVGGGSNPVAATISDSLPFRDFQRTY